jgi:iron complex outermembrane receptor protein
VNSGHDTMQRNQASLQALFMHALSKNWAVRGVAMVTYNDNLKNWMATTYDGYPNAAAGLIAWSRTLVEESHEIRTNYALQADLAGAFRTGPFSHQLVAGADLKYSTSKTGFSHTPFAAEDRLFDFYHPDYDVSFGAKTPHRRVDKRGTRANFHISENTKALGDRVILSLGARASDFTQVADRFWYFPKADRPHVEVPAKWVVSPRAGLVVKILEPVSLYYGYAETYQPHENTNPDDTFIEPETGTQHEAGVKAFLFKGRVILNSSVYDLQRDNVARDVYNYPGYPNIAYYLTDRSIRVQGVNIRLTINPVAGLQLNGSYSACDPEIIKADGQPGQIGKSPKNLAKIRYNWNVRYEFRKGRLRGLTTGVFGARVGERPADFPTEAVPRPFATPAYDRYDAFIRYARKKWSLQLNVNNLFDKRCYTYAEYTYYADGGGSGAIRRAPPREFTLTYHRDF